MQTYIKKAKDQTLLLILVKSKKKLIMFFTVKNPNLYFQNLHINYYYFY